MPDEEQITNSALHYLMHSAKRSKKKHPNQASSPKNDQSKFFPCPAGCGHHVSEREVNTHLDKSCPIIHGGGESGSMTARCSVDESDATDNKRHASTDGSIFKGKHMEHPSSCIFNHTDEVFVESHHDHSSSASAIKNGCIAQSKIIQRSQHNSNMPSHEEKTPSKQNINRQNAFSHMMKQSAKFFNGDESECTANYQFHLHYDQNGRITTNWTFDQSDPTFSMNDTVWSATVTIKKLKSVALHSIQASDALQQLELHKDATTLALVVSSSIACQQVQTIHCDNTSSRKFYFVQQHSRFSVCLKSASILTEPIKLIYTTCSLLVQPIGSSAQINTPKINQKTSSFTFC